MSPRARAEPRAAITLTLTLEPVVNNVRADLTVAAARDRLSLSRVGPSGVRAYVRGYESAVVSPGAVIVRDFEAPVGVPLTYTVTTWAAAAPATTDTGTASITIAEQGCDDTWLTDLVRPNNTQKVVLESLPELAYTVPVGVHEILARRTPIVSTDIADTPTFELSFLTGDDEHARARPRHARQRDPGAAAYPARERDREPVLRRDRVSRATDRQPRPRG